LTFFFLLFPTFFLFVFLFFLIANPCHSDYSLQLLQETDHDLDKAALFVRHIVQQLSPLNTSLVNLHSDVHDWSQRGEHVRQWAVLIPMGATLVYVVFEMIATCNPLPCCDLLCRMSRTLARVVGWVTLCGLLSSATVYFVLGLASSDYCTRVCSSSVVLRFLFSLSPLFLFSEYIFSNFFFFFLQYLVVFIHKGVNPNQALINGA
jgi:hypothetical protein